jgi:subtilisin
MGVFLCLSCLEEAYGADKSVIVGFHRNPGSYEKSLIKRSRGRIRRTYKRVRAMSVTLDEKEIERLKRDTSNIAYVEEDAVIMAVEPVLSQEYIDSWGVNHIGAENAHASGNKGRGVKVAVIDSGIDYTHVDLQDNYRGGYDFVFNDDDPYDDNRISHGTHMAGIIAAQENNAGVIGVAPEADIYAVKVLDGAGFGLLSWLVAGIEWSVENGIDVINMSLGGDRDFQSLRDACEYAYSEGVLIIAAAGNTYGGEVQYPAAYGTVVAVTGTDALDMQATFSPYGPEIELAAPGLDILSTVVNGNYDTLSGTSQAAAHVAGTAALFYGSDIEDVNGDLIIDNIDVRSALQATAIDAGDEGPDNVYGYGIVDASAASLPVFEPLYLTLERNSRFPRHDMEAVSLSDGVYEIKTENHGLGGMRMVVYEGDTFMRKLSRVFRFPQEKRSKFSQRKRHRFSRAKYKKKRTRTITIDVQDTEYDIYFTPYGKRGASADLTITEKKVDAIEGQE